MGFTDFILAPFYIVVCYLLARYFAFRKLPATVDNKRIFRNAIIAKFIAIIGFILIYRFYYHGGDTFAFHFWGNELVRYFFQSPGDALNFYMNSADESVYLKFYYFSPPSIYNYLMKYEAAEVQFTKITAIINLLSFKSFLCASFIFGLLSFIGSWKLFEVFAAYAPSQTRNISFAILLVPSVLFWGSSIMKDTVTFAALGLLTNCIYYGIIQRQRFIPNILLGVLCSYIIILIKGYIILTFLPAAVLWVFFTYRAKIQSRFIQIALLPGIIVLSGVVVYFMVTQISSSLGKFSLDRLQDTALGYQTWHSVASEEMGGSGYKLGNIGDFSINNLILEIPAAINVTLYRPHLFEANSPIIFIAALESLFLLLFTLWVLIRGRFYRVFTTIFSDPLLLFSFVFVLIFAFSVGITSFNFGALVRYKIPCIPFFTALLVIINSRLSRNQDVRA